MCGISGLWRKSGIREEDRLNSRKSLQLLRQRGPDFSATCEVIPEILFNHARLSVLDPYPSSNQPITSKCRRYTIVFNGQIYNYRELSRKTFSRNTRNINLFTNHETVKSDTHAILDALSVYGVFKTIELLNGMYAIAIYDHQEKNLFLTRDYYGQKPLYYHITPQFICFSSNLLDCAGLSSTSKGINISTASEYIEFGMSLGEDTLFDGVYELQPNQTLIVSSNHNGYLEHYFSTAKTSQSLSSHAEFGNLDLTIENIIQDHLLSDAKVGLLLSGGIDSTIVSYVASYMKAGMTAYTYDYKNSGDIQSSRLVASSLGIEHKVIENDDQELVKIVDQSFAEFDVPISDPATFSSRLLHRKAKIDGFKVLLNGDGADESF